VSKLRSLRRRHERLRQSLRVDRPAELVGEDGIVIDVGMDRSSFCARLSVSVPPALAAALRGRLVELVLGLNRRTLRRPRRLRATT
jgi:hypothetical protein